MVQLPLVAETGRRIGRHRSPEDIGDACARPGAADEGGVHARAGGLLTL